MLLNGDELNDTTRRRKTTNMQTEIHGTLYVCNTHPKHKKRGILELKMGKQ